MIFWLIFLLFFLRLINGTRLPHTQEIRELREFSNYRKSQGNSGRLREIFILDLE